MQELVFCLSIVIGFGLFSYWFMAFIVKLNHKHPINDQPSEEIDEMEKTILHIQEMNASGKLKAIILLGGMVFTEIAVSLINFPFTIVENMKTKKTN